MRLGTVNTTDSLLGDITRWTGVDSSTYTKHERLVDINEEYRLVNQKIWKASGTWQFDDSNYTTLPFAEGDLVAGREDYTLPSTAQRLLGVAVKDKDGNWVGLKQYDPEELGMAFEEFQETDGLPRYYDLIGNVLKLKPAPSASQTTITNGLRVYVSRNIKAFSISDTNSSPGFAEDFHRMLSIGASYNYLLANQGSPDQLNRLRAKLREYEELLENFYGSRNVDRSTRIEPRYESTI